MTMWESKFINNWKEYILSEVAHFRDYGDFIKIIFNKWEKKWKVYKSEWGEAIKYNWISEWYYVHIFWDYFRLQNTDGQQIFKKEWWDPIKIDWISEFPWVKFFWKYIEVKFNKLDKWKRYYCKYIWLTDYYLTK